MKTTIQILEQIISKATATEKADTANIIARLVLGEPVTIPFAKYEHLVNKFTRLLGIKQKFIMNADNTKVDKVNIKYIDNMNEFDETIYDVSSDKG